MERLDLQPKYLSKDEYKILTNIDLDVELRGSTDDDSNAAQTFIFHSERELINYLETNFDFKEEMIEGLESNHLIDFKIALANYVSFRKDEREDMKNYAYRGLRRLGFMNMRRL